MKINVKDGNVEKALRKMGKKLTESGKLQEVRERQQYIKPSIENRERHKAAKKRWARHLANQTLPTKLF
jgi:small subunit ribosomal protein S21